MEEKEKNEIIQNQKIIGIQNDLTKIKINQNFIIKLLKEILEDKK